MGVYYITLFIVFIFTVLAKAYDYKFVQYNSLGRVKHTQLTMAIFLFAVCTLIFVAGFRYNVGSDFKNYYIGYVQSSKLFFERLITLNEPGYYFLCWITVLIKGNGTTAIFLAAAVTVILYLKTIYENTNCLITATLLYLFLGCWHGSFNGIRQYLASAIIFSGIRYIKEKQFWKYALTVFIAFLFHTSAIIMIFAYFITHWEIRFRNIAFLIIGSVVILFSFNGVLELAGFLLKQNYGINSAYITRSVNGLRILVAVAPAIFFLIFYWNREKTNDQKMWLNLLILNGIMMFATSNSAYLARMGIYTTPFLALGIPELLKEISFRNRNILRVVILLLYVIFWWYDISQAGALNNFKFVF